jgi:hypothetical protein
MRLRMLTRDARCHPSCAGRELTIAGRCSCSCTSCCASATSGAAPTVAVLIWELDRSLRKLPERAYVATRHRAGQCTTPVSTRPGRLSPTSRPRKLTHEQAPWRSCASRGASLPAIHRARTVYARLDFRLASDGALYFLEAKIPTPMIGARGGGQRMFARACRGRRAGKYPGGMIQRFCSPRRLHRRRPGLSGLGRRGRSGTAGKRRQVVLGQARHLGAVGPDGSPSASISRRCTCALPQQHSRVEHHWRLVRPRTLEVHDGRSRRPGLRASRRLASVERGYSKSVVGVADEGHVDVEVRPQLDRALGCTATTMHRDRAPCPRTRAAQGGATEARCRARSAYRPCPRSATQVRQIGHEQGPSPGGRCRPPSSRPQAQVQA